MSSTAPTSRRSSRWWPALLLALLARSAEPQLAGAQGSPELGDDGIGVPMRVRDFTYPSHLVLSFAPQPAAPLGRGRFGVELIVSRVNDFQVSPAAERYLRQRHGGARRALDEADIAFIVGLPEGQGYYIDGEFDFYELGLHYGVSERLDIGITLYGLDAGGGSLDGTIFDFHESLGFGQQGRDGVADDQFQILYGVDGRTIARFDDPPTGGVADPSLFARYALPGRPGGWAFNVSAGLKVPLADEDEGRSTGSADFGLLLAADRRWRRNALIANLSVVQPGEFTGSGYDSTFRSSLHLVWLHRFARWPRTRFFLQGLAAQHLLAELTDSALADVELQLTTGAKWDTRLGVLGLGVTENVLNHDNTPDIGVHVSWGYLSR